MFYLSLLFPSLTRTQTRMNISAASHAEEREMFAGTDMEASTGVRAEERTDDYLLRSGIVSMEHWLDLNA